MSHRLLFDENLAPRLVGLLANQFPDALHVRDLGLEHALDIELLDDPGVRIVQVTRATRG